MYGIIKTHMGISPNSARGFYKSSVIWGNSQLWKNGLVFTPLSYWSPENIENKLPVFLLHQVYGSYTYKIPFICLTFQFRGLTLLINVSRETDLIVIHWGFQIDLLLNEFIPQFRVTGVNVRENASVKFSVWSDF